MINTETNNIIATAYFLSEQLRSEHGKYEQLIKSKRREIATELDEAYDILSDANEKNELCISSADKLIEVCARCKVTAEYLRNYTDARNQISEKLSRLNAELNYRNR